MIILQCVTMNIIHEYCCYTPFIIYIVSTTAPLDIPPIHIYTVDIIYIVLSVLTTLCNALHKRASKNIFVFSDKPQNTFMSNII